MTRNRYPPKTDKYLGEKLRCYKTKFLKYTNWGLNTRQRSQNQIDWDEKENEGIIKTVRLQNIGKILKVKSFAD